MSTGRTITTHPISTPLSFDISETYEAPEYQLPADGNDRQAVLGEFETLQIYGDRNVVPILLGSSYAYTTGHDLQQSITRDSHDAAKGGLNRKGHRVKWVKSERRHSDDSVATQDSKASQGGKVKMKLKRFFVLAKK